MQRVPAGKSSSARGLSCHMGVQDTSRRPSPPPELLVGRATGVPVPSENDAFLLGVPATQQRRSEQEVDPERASEQLMSRCRTQTEAAGCKMVNNLSVHSALNPALCPNRCKLLNPSLGEKPRGPGQMISLGCVAYFK